MSTPTTHRRKLVSRVDKRHVIDLPDTGCRFAPSCLACPWARCYYTLSDEDRRQFTAALAAIRPFVRAPDRALGD
jgi:hypothetical protein